MSDLVGNPEDRFSQNEAHFSVHKKRRLDTRACAPVEVRTHSRYFPFQVFTGKYKKIQIKIKKTGNTIYFNAQGTITRYWHFRRGLNSYVLWLFKDIVSALATGPYEKDPIKTGREHLKTPGFNCLGTDNSSPERKIQPKLSLL